ncbi:hypothetical protein L2E82_32183 [Cichorium intybus]|uniref:Uncharacterized protein n=1 Tax=Cichorium intybus TaxID=13427 RepID=A0ACB9BF99_CICIN|nr:hypothetical protein L2E82_32183 [Cichorium intybus]
MPELLILLNTHHHKSTPKSIVTPKSINATRSSTTPRNRHHPPPMLNHGTPPPITRSAYHYLSVHVSSEVTGKDAISFLKSFMKSDDPRQMNPTSRNFFKHWCS